MPEVALRLLNKYDYAEAQAEFKLAATCSAAGQRLAAARKTIPDDGNGNRAGPIPGRKKGGGHPPRSHSGYSLPRKVGVRYYLIAWYNTLCALIISCDNKQA